jgi:hypothetical protein
VSFNQPEVQARSAIEASQVAPLADSLLRVSILAACIRQHTYWLLAIVLQERPGKSLSNDVQGHFTALLTTDASYVSSKRRETRGSRGVVCIRVSFLTVTHRERIHS